MSFRPIIAAFICAVAHATDVAIIEEPTKESIENGNLRSRRLAPGWCDTITVKPIDYQAEDGKYYIDISWFGDRRKYYEFCFKPWTSFNSGMKWTDVCHYQTAKTPRMDSKGVASFRELVPDHSFKCETSYNMIVWKKRQLWSSSCKMTFRTGKCGCPDPSCPHGGTLWTGNRCGWEVPYGTKAFIYKNNGYYTPSYRNPICPNAEDDGIEGTLVDDGTKCLIYTLDSDYKPWMWPNSWGAWYYTDIETGVCPIRPFPESGFDGANCLVARVPGGYVGLVENGSYYTHVKDLCPLSGSKFDSSNCYYLKDIPNIKASGRYLYYDACP